MKLIDEKGKLFGIINVVDLFVLLLIVVLAVFGFQKAVDKNPTIATETKKVTFMVWLQEVRNVTVDAIQEGEIAKDTDKNLELGKVVKKEVFPAKRLVATEDGRVFETLVPDRFDIALYIEGDATVSPSSIVIANNDIRVGTLLKVKGLKFAVAGHVFEVDVME